jgi:hypothetical protein
MAKLTIRKIDSLKPGDTAKEYADGHIPGLYFELRPSGKASCYWLIQDPNDPAKALRDTQLGYLKKDDPALHDPRVWAPYILIE